MTGGPLTAGHVELAVGVASRTKDRVIVGVGAEPYCRPRVLMLTGDETRQLILALSDALHSLRDQPQSDATIEDVYADRNLAVQLAAMYAGADACWTTDERTPGWPVLIITTPEGQVSWHVPADQRYVTTPTPEEQGPRGPAGPREASEGGSMPSDGWLF